MFELEKKDVLVIGLGSRGQAACGLLRRLGARVTGVDSEETPELRAAVETLCQAGVESELGALLLPKRTFDLAVLSPEVPAISPLVRAIFESKVPMISELDLGFQQAKCLCIAIAGTSGKSTTAELVERMLANNHRKTVLAGPHTQPICAVVEQTRELDFLILQVDSFQLARTEFLRPAVAVLMNLSPDHLERFPTVQEHSRLNARLFKQQQAFDWAIVQSEALARLRELKLPVPAKTITFSATDPVAELRLDRGLLISRIPNWAGPLLDMDHCQVWGPHNAENLMAALAIGHVLHLPLEGMLDALKTYKAGPHRCELVAEINGVQFVNDSKAMNLDALRKTLLGARAGQGGEANVWLIAGGKDKGLEYHDVGPVLSKRVKRAFLIGEAKEKIRAAWSLFTPCTVSNSLLEAVTEAAENATSGDVVLLSPACSSFDQFQNYQQRGEEFCEAVKSIGRGVRAGTPNRNGKNAAVGSVNENFAERT